MSRAGKSILAFSIYIGLLGCVLVLSPNPLLALLGLPPAEDYWILVAGMLLVGLSVYYAFAGLNHLLAFVRLTAFARLLILPYFIILVLIKKAPPPILIFGVIDMLFAIWTLIALRRDRVLTSLGAA
jgi:hypothetical protein